MDIRLQPRELDIPQADPFANDLLERQPEIAALTNVLASMSLVSVRMRSNRRSTVSGRMTLRYSLRL